MAAALSTICLSLRAAAAAEMYLTLVLYQQITCIYYGFVTISPAQSMTNVPEPNQEINPMTQENSPALEEGEIAKDLQYPPEIGVLPFTCVSSGDKNPNGNGSAGNA